MARQFHRSEVDPNRFALLIYLDCADAITANSAEHASALVRSGSRSAMQVSVHEDSEASEGKASPPNPPAVSGSHDREVRCR